MDPFKAAGPVGVFAGGPVPFGNGFMETFDCDGTGAGLDDVCGGTDVDDAGTVVEGVS